MTDPTQARALIYGRQSSGKEKSIAEQIRECVADATAQGWTVLTPAQDGSSASRYATKARDSWPAVLAAIEEGAVDVLVLWESSRGDRNLTTWSALLDLCRERRVKIRITSHEHTYNLENANDWRVLATDGVDAAHESGKLSVRVRRGVAAAAAGGRPPMGPAPYGHRRVYDPTTGALVGQEPDPETAPIVVEIVDKLGRSVPVSEVARQLNGRGIPAPKGGIWRRMAVRDTALNPAHVALRVHNDQLHPATWEPIVDAEAYYKASRVLRDPARLELARPGRQKHLLSYLATCHNGHPIRTRATYYLCSPGCSNIVRARVDELVTEQILLRLSRPDAYESLVRAGAEDDKAVLAARGEAARLRAELDRWRESAAEGKTSPESLAVVEARLLAKIRAADGVAASAAVPPALRDILKPGADVRKRWAAATLPAQRDIIRALAEVVIRPAEVLGGRWDPLRLGASRWVGDGKTWADYWAEAAR